MNKYHRLEKTKRNLGGVLGRSRGKKGDLNKVSESRSPFNVVNTVPTIRVNKSKSTFFYKTYG